MALPDTLLDQIRARLPDPETRVEYPAPQPGVTQHGGGVFHTVASFRPEAATSDVDT